MTRRSFPLLALVLLFGLTLAGGLYAQMESGDRGILPVDSSGTLEIGGIHVDVAGKNAEDARYAGWREAQRRGFRALWSKMHNRPVSEAPRISDSVLDGLVSSISVTREQIGPNRYIADLGVLFDRARAAELLGVGGPVRRSAPMLLMPVLVTAGTDMMVESRNPWQRAWAELRTETSPIDYVRVSGIGMDPLLANAAQTHRPGRGWWRNLIDFHGAADILIADAQLHRAYPGGPAIGRFTGYHGPDRDILGSFTITSPEGNVAAMMQEAVRRMDALYTRALAAGRLERDPTLNIPEPPPPPEEEEEEPQAPAQAEEGRPWVYQVQIVSPEVTVYNFAMAHLRTTAGVETAVPIAINPGGTSYVNVTYRGDLSGLVAALAARGWNVERTGFVLRMSGRGGSPPPLPPPPQPVPQPAPAPQQPPSQSEQ